MHTKLKFDQSAKHEFANEQTAHSLGRAHNDCPATSKVAMVSASSVLHIERVGADEAITSLALQQDACCSPSELLHSESAVSYALFAVSRQSA